MKATLQILGLQFLLLLPSSGYCWYNPQTGRWLNRDPIGESSGPNQYALVSNASPNDTDILGTCGGGSDDTGSCHCQSVEIKFHPGGKRFSWGITRDPFSKVAPVKLGNNIEVVVTASGKRSRREFHQDERKARSTAGFNAYQPRDFHYEGTIEGQDKIIPMEIMMPVDPAHPTEDSAYFYYDRLGITLGQKGSGYYFGRLGFKKTDELAPNVIIFLCKSTDGTSIQRKLTLAAEGIASLTSEGDASVVADNILQFKLE